MRAILVGVCALLATAGTAAAQSVEIEDAVARVTVTPEARSDIVVEVTQGSSGLPPISVRQRGRNVFIDGGVSERDIRECKYNQGGVRRVEVRGVGDVDVDAAPHIHIRTPLTVEIEADGALWGSVGRTDALQLANAGCGDWTVANVRNRLELDIAGSGDTRVGSVGSAEISIAGSGDTLLRSVASGLDVSIAGSGDVRIGQAGGRVDVDIAGSGDVIVDTGRGAELSASIAGSGDVRFNGPVTSVSAQIAGSGDVRVASVSGNVSKAIVGSGSVIVGD